MRAISRMTGVSRNTVNKLLIDLGTACSAYQDKAFRNLKCKRIQCDEIWCFVGCKQKNVSPENVENGWGSVWTWVAMDAETPGIRLTKLAATLQRERLLIPGVKWSSVLAFHQHLCDLREVTAS